MSILLQIDLRNLVLAYNNNRSLRLQLQYTFCRDRIFYQRRIGTVSSSPASKLNDIQKTIDGWEVGFFFMRKITFQILSSFIR